MDFLEDSLTVYVDRCELRQGETVQVYREGKQSEETQNRYKKITTALGGGYLEQIIDNLNALDLSVLPSECKRLLRCLVDSVTSEVGRALVGLTFLQLTIKSIAPEQCVRLHKGSGKGGSSFSWTDGISMRTLDKDYSAPFLRKHGLLNLNRDGVFMTRSLAENYPFTRLYKARMRGAFNEWLDIVDRLEAGIMPPKQGLVYLISLLKNRTEAFRRLADATIAKARTKVFSSLEEATEFMTRFFNITDYSARAFEVVIHSFMQAATETAWINYDLVPISQMRSANKKHGNVGDIELTEGGRIIEAWDAKYGKPYLRDELEELRDKILLASNDLRTVGFIVDDKIDRRCDVVKRVEEIVAETDVELKLFSFNEWIKYKTQNIGQEQARLLASHWLTAVAESLGQKRRALAPIDEPCDGWLRDLERILD